MEGAWRGPGGIQVSGSTGLHGNVSLVALMLHHDMFVPRSTHPLCPAANDEFEKHLAEEIVAEKEVGKKAADVPTLPAVPDDLFCFSGSFCFL